MARGKVHLCFRDGGRMLARTDLTGHGVVSEGEEFIAREMWPTGRGLWPGGKKLRVRVEQVERVQCSYHIVHVTVLEDLTPEPGKQEELFR